MHGLKRNSVLSKGQRETVRISHHSTFYKKTIAYSRCFPPHNPMDFSLDNPITFVLKHT